MNVDILIPTLSSLADLSAQIESIQRTRATTGAVIASCRPGSASENRNRCLAEATSEIVIMLDDDIEGFFPRWDVALIAPLLLREDVAMVAARLMSPKDPSQPAFMCTGEHGHGYDLTASTVGIPIGLRTALPTACVAFRRAGATFDEGFIGSGFEDNDFCLALQRRMPGGVFLVNNECRLIHRNEAKNQRGAFWAHNQAHYERKWGLA